MNSKTIIIAKEIWDYFSSFSYYQHSDAVVICCSYDLRVCDYACSLIKAGVSDSLVISGKHGSWTKHLWQKTEAEVFYDRAIENGILKEQITLEPHATNFGENIKYSIALIPYAKTITFVTKPNALLRAKLTAQAQLTTQTTYVASSKIEFPIEVSNVIGIWGVINEMVGDINRILKYPEYGYQKSHNLPKEILAHYSYLVEQGFIYNLLPDFNTN